MPVDPHSLETDQSGRFFAFETYFQVLFPPIPKGVGVPTLKHGESQAAEDSDGDGAEDNDENHDEPEEGEGEMHTPLLLISKEPLTNIKGSHSQVRMPLICQCFAGCLTTPLEQVLSPDFMLVGNNVQLARGYYAKFVHPDRQQECVLWGGYVSMVKPQVQMAGNVCAHVRCAFGMHNEPMADRSRVQRLGRGSPRGRRYQWQQQQRISSCPAEQARQVDGRGGQQVRPLCRTRV